MPENTYELSMLRELSEDLPDRDESYWEETYTNTKGDVDWEGIMND